MNHATHSLANEDEITRYEQALKNFQSGAMDADRFQGVRLQLGLYGQRQAGVHMVRVKLPGGRVQPHQLRAIADVVEQHSEHGFAHITTRQDIQIHFVPLADTPLALRRLARDGLTTREACNNTVRNVTACPLAGVCWREHVDVKPFVQGVARHFLRHPATQSMPRKFKISFSGCEADCAQGLIHDIGVIAVRNDDGRLGFKVLAAGGLGHKPREALVIEPFIDEKDLLPVLEAAIALHNRYSDGSKRARSRSKFLVDRFGPQGFIEKYREELDRTGVALAGQLHPQGRWITGKNDDATGAGAPRRLYKQKQAGLYVYPVTIPQGELSVAALRGIADLAENLGLDDIRTTQDQNLMLLNVPEAELSAVNAELARHGLAAPRRGDNIVACPGASTCRLGITASMKLAPKLSGGENDLRLRVSGCHNGCAQPETGDIGIYGEGKRLFGKLIPHYQLYFGGEGSDGTGLALKGPSVPSVRIESAVERVQKAYAAERNEQEGFHHWTRRQAPGYFKHLLSDLASVSEREVDALRRDHGDSADFRVLSLGGGECGAPAKASAAPLYYEAANERRYRNAYYMQREYSEALACAEAIATLVGKALAFPAAAYAQNLAGNMQDKAPEHLYLAENQAALLAEFARLRDAPDDKALPELFADLDAWTVEAGKYSLAQDRQLDLTGMLPQVAAKAQTLALQPRRRVHPEEETRHAAARR